MRQQYGLRIQSEEFASMGWDEFADLLAGLGADTPLASVVQTRLETDRDRIRAMTPGQRRMRSDWQRKRASKMPKKETEAFMRQMQDGLARMFGGQDAGDQRGSGCSRP